MSDKTKKAMTVRLRNNRPQSFTYLLDLPGTGKLRGKSIKDKKGVVREGMERRGGVVRKAGIDYPSVTFGARRSGASPFPIQAIPAEALKLPSIRRDLMLGNLSKVR